uniref:Alpha-2-MRAP_C domain-containing protein n=1 Tax=Panagrellus redivivus TaxID=6233 RepID=A0A7E4VSA0_PANRE
MVAKLIFSKLRSAPANSTDLRDPFDPSFENSCPESKMRLHNSYIFLLFLLATCWAAEKSKFRMEKINFIWSKVLQNKAIPSATLDKLKVDLGNFDTLYLAEKQDGEHQKKKSASLNEINGKLEKLLERFDLDDALRAFRIKYKYETSKIYAESHHENAAKKDSSGSVFTDARVQKLWTAARDDDDLVPDELDDFYNRLTAIDGKIAAYLELLSTHKERNGNMLDVDEEHDKTLAVTKRANNEIEAELKDLNAILTQTRDNPFHEPKARKLWAKILSQSLPTNELVTLKSEVRQLEKLIMKVAHHLEVLNDVKNMHATHSKDKPVYTEDDYISQLQSEQEKLERKVVKMEAYIQEHLEKLKAAKHEEL